MPYRNIEDRRACNRKCCRAYYLRHSEQRKAKARAKYIINRDKENARVAAYARLNRKKVSIRSNKWARSHRPNVYLSEIKHLYGITKEQYYEMLVKQDGVCAICHRLPGEDKYTRGRLALDHCHKRNIIRGLLCNSCNAGIGHFSDDIDRLKAAIAYLEASNAIPS